MDKPRLKNSWNDIFSVKNFEAGAFEMVGMDLAEDGVLSGWGMANIANKTMQPTAKHFAWNVSGSAFRTVMGPILSTKIGWEKEGLLGAGKWLLGEYAQSTIMGYVFRTAASKAGKAAGYSVGRAMVGSMIGGFTDYSFGSAIGAAMGTPLGMGTGMAAAALIGPGALATEASYYVGKASYSVLKQGYAFEQQRKKSLETAGSTAAYMTKAAGSMRQKAIMAINAHQLNARSALGQEAQIGNFNTMRKFR